jgi:predicted phosphate transport protein (TIGR00153 family)
MKLFPSSTDFFELFDRAASNATHTAEVLVSLMEERGDFAELAKRVYDAEQEGDLLTHDIIKKLNKTFITPIDREDLYALASRLDDIVDLIWSAVDRMTLFKVGKPTGAAISMSKDLLATTEVISKTIKKLKEKKYGHVQEFCIEINRLENRIDRDFRDALGKLFDENKDPIYIIKWKEIYEHLEDASDRCEDVANIIEAIVLKHA